MKNISPTPLPAPRAHHALPPLPHSVSKLIFFQRSLSISLHGFFEHGLWQQKTGNDILLPFTPLSELRNPHPPYTAQNPAGLPSLGW